MDIYKQQNKSQISETVQTPKRLQKITKANTEATLERQKKKSITHILSSIQPSIIVYLVWNIFNFVNLIFVLCEIEMITSTCSINMKIKL